MKSNKFNLGIVLGLTLLTANLSANLTLAQNLDLLQLKPLTVEPKPTQQIQTKQTQQTQTAQPADTGGVISTNNTNTNLSSTSSSTTATTTSTGTKTVNRTPDGKPIITNTSTTGNNPVLTEIQDLPLIDADNPASSENQCPQIKEQSQCLNPSNAQRIILPKILSNQIKIILLMILGTLIGSGFWIFSLHLRGQSQHARNQNKINRHLKSFFQQKKESALLKTFNEMAGAIAELNMNGSTAIQKLKMLSKDFELFGSNQTRDANKDFLDLVSNPKSNSDEIIAARRALIRAIKNDLNLS